VSRHQRWCQSSYHCFCSLQMLFWVRLAILWLFMPQDMCFYITSEAIWTPSHISYIDRAGNRTGVGHLDVVLTGGEWQADQTDSVHRHDLVANIELAAPSGGATWCHAGEHNCRNHAAPARLHYHHAQRLVLQLRNYYLITHKRIHTRKSYNKCILCCSYLTSMMFVFIFIIKVAHEALKKR